MSKFKSWGLRAFVLAFALFLGLGYVSTNAHAGGGGSYYRNYNYGVRYYSPTAYRYYGDMRYYKGDWEPRCAGGARWDWDEERCEGGTGDGGGTSNHHRDHHRNHHRNHHRSHRSHNRNHHGSRHGDHRISHSYTGNHTPA